MVLLAKEIETLLSALDRSVPHSPNAGGVLPCVPHYRGPLHVASSVLLTSGSK